MLAACLVLLGLAAGEAPPAGKGAGCAGRRSGAGNREEQAEVVTRDLAREETEPRGDLSRPDHGHPAFQERAAERREMVRDQMELREIKDPNVLRAMRLVPRHAFVPAAQQTYAYEDRPLPIGHGQTISQPYVVAFMTETLALGPNSVVLEIGTGSGYQAAICAEIARAVYTVEIVEPLAAAADELLKKLGYRNVRVRTGDGYHGWPEHGPFDAIIGTAAARDVPPPLVEQLKPGGRMILPVGTSFGLQYLILLTKDEEGHLQRHNVMPVLFVPMTGRIEQSVE